MYTLLNVTKRFVGREQECIQLSRAILAPSRHAVVFGDRGVGKTSTTKLVTESFRNSDNYKIIEYRCGGGDEYKSIVYKLLKELGLISVKRTKLESLEQSIKANLKVVFANGGAKSTRKKEDEIIQLVQSELTPDFLVSQLAQEKAILLIDEFDRVIDEHTKLFVADTIKILSDYKSASKMIICGVSNTAVDLFGKHESTVRNIWPIKIPYMSNDELRVVIDNGLNEIGITFSETLKTTVMRLSEGLPYFTHLLCEELTVNAISTNKVALTIADLFPAVIKASKNISETITAPYLRAVSIPKRFRVQNFNLTPNSPRIVRKSVIFGVALAPNNSALDIAETTNQLIAESGIWMSEDYTNMDDTDIEIIVDEIIELSSCLVKNNDLIYFNSPFLKAYSLMKALEEHGKCALSLINTSRSVS